MQGIGEHAMAAMAAGGTCYGCRGDVRWLPVHGNTRLQQGDVRVHGLACMAGRRNHAALCREG